MKHLGWYLVGGAVVAGFAYALYRLTQPLPNGSNTPNSVSSSVAAPLNSNLYGVTGFTNILLPGDIANTTDVAQTNPGVV